MVGGRGKVPDIKGEPRIHTSAQSHQGNTCGAGQCIPSSAGTLCRALGSENILKHGHISQV